MDTLRTILDPHFLLRNSVYISLLVGLVCPSVGVYLVLRRLIFMGVALPQISSCGIAFTFALQGWGLLVHFHQSEHSLAFFGSTLFTIPTIILLSLLVRRGRGSVESRLGTVYVLAGAWSILLLVTNPSGEHGLLDMLKGEIIAIPDADLEWTAAIFCAVILLLFLFRKEFLVVSFDREMAVTLKKNVLFWDALLFLLIGVTISMAVLSVGPLVAFGFLLIPSLIAHLFARNMRQFALIAPVIGGVTAFCGFCIAYRWDYPVGPTDVALLGVVYGLAFLGQKAVGFLKSKRGRVEAVAGAQT
jgi:ABC-type Mn2+/Zn2+ transport system permease subunit